MATVFLVGVGEPERTVWIATLKRAGHAVLEAADAAAAIDLTAAGTPDLVVMSPADTDAGAIARLADALPDRAQALREHEDDVDFAMSVARIGVSYRPLDSPDIFISRSLGTLMGLPRGTVQISRDDLFRHIHPDDVSRVGAAVDDAIARGSDFQLEYRWHSAEDGWRWFRSTGRVSTSRAGQPARLFTSIADVTEQRSLELQLQQVQKMEAIGQLAGGVAHDFNNLLTAIGGYASLLLETADQAQRHDLEEILKAARRAAALTKQLLAFSRRQQMEPAVVDLNGLIENMAAVLRRIIGENIQLTTRLTADGASVRADRDQLEQVVMNLVVNAREATGSHGDIRLETAVVTLGNDANGLRLEAPPGTYVMFSVIDTGHGMTEDTKARLFEPFFTTKPPGQGTGLGLATVYGIIAQSGGSIEVTSEPGTGSTFTVYMPKQQRTPPAARQPDEVPAPGGHEIILLVEDEAPIRALARVILERAGYTVVEAANPAEAHLRSESMPRIDLLLTDVVMPGGTGPELFRLLAEDRASMRVLFMSGYAEQDLFDRAAVAPGGAFLPKPFSKQQLIGRVREALDAQGGSRQSAVGRE
jgi:signal transduction histidine kinase/ActR/RegA family two-component response regulator